MIYIQRPLYNPFEQTDLYKNQVELLQKWKINPQEDRKGWKSPGELLHKDKSIRENFYSSFNYKCAYCEVTLNQDKGVLSFFRPRIKALPNTVNSSNSNNNCYYHWLSWTWSNLYLACSKCAFNKGKQFPVSNQRVKVGIDDSEALSLEKHLLLDPCLENPNKYLVFHENGTVEARLSSPRGLETIKILNLNRDELIVARQEEIIKLRAYFYDVLLQISDLSQRRSDVVTAVENLKLQCKADQVFAGMKRQLMYKWLKFLEHSLTSYICDYYYNCSTSLQNNSLIEEKIFNIKSSILLSLLTEKLPLKRLIKQLQNWLNDSNNFSQIITTDTQNDFALVPEWLNNTFPNEKTIETIDSITVFLTELEKENPNIENSNEVLSKIQTEYQNQSTELHKILNLLINSPSPDILDRDRWVKSTMALLIHLRNEKLFNHFYFEAFRVWLERFLQVD